jgi:intracellular multiplication protein IcmL
MEAKDALVLIFSRNAFYKRLHYLALAVFTLCVIAIITLTWVLFFLLKNPSQPLYFVTDDVGRLIRIVPVNTPNMTTEDVVQWTIEAVEAAYSYDYINYRAQLQSAQKYFTNYGWNNYMGAIRGSNNLLAITQRKWVGIAKVVGKPKIIVEGILSGAYAWKFEMPVLVTYSYAPFDDQSKITNPLLVTVIVQRQPPLQGYKGLGIVQSIALLITTGTTTPEISSTGTT